MREPISPALIPALGEPASDETMLRLAVTVADRVDHEKSRYHRGPERPDPYCEERLLWAGERVGPVVRRVLDAEEEALQHRLRGDEDRKRADEAEAELERLKGLESTLVDLARRWSAAPGVTGAATGWSDAEGFEQAASDLREVLSRGAVPERLLSPGELNARARKALREEPAAVTPTGDPFPRRIYRERVVHAADADGRFACSSRLRFDPFLDRERPPQASVTHAMCLRNHTVDRDRAADAENAQRPAHLALMSASARAAAQADPEMEVRPGMFKGNI